MDEKPYMRNLLIVNFILCTLLFFTSGFYGSDDHFIHLHTQPMVYVAAGASLTALVGLIFKRLRGLFVLLNALAMFSLRPAAIHGLTDWPGGDDGGYFGWLFLVCGGSFIAIFLAVASIFAFIFSLFRFIISFFEKKTEKNITQ